MGQEVSHSVFTREQRLSFRERVITDLDVFEQMLEGSRFDFTRPQMGLEIELNLVNQDNDPSFHNAEVLRAIADPDYQTELARYNIELNSPPMPLLGDSGLQREQQLRASLNRAEEVAKQRGSRIVMIGILPTLREEHF